MRSLCFCLLLCVPFAGGQVVSQGQINQRAIDTEMGLGTSLIVHLQQENGRSVSALAIVRLSSTHIAARTLRGVWETKDATFATLPEGDYLVEVDAEGYQRTRQEVTVIRGGANRCFIVLKEGAGDDAQMVHKLTPPLAAKPRKEMETALAALRDNKPDEAWKHVDFGLKHAPGHPDILYVAGLYYRSKKDYKNAGTYFESALKAFPEHANARMAWSEMLLSEGKGEESIPHLEKIVAMEPGSSRGHWLLAEAILMSNRDLPGAKFHATRAVALGKEPNPAHKTLERAEEALNSAATTISPASRKSVAELAAEMKAGELPSTMSTRWPKDIDQAVPPADDPASCALPQLLAGASRRASEFAGSLERFSATERIEQEEMDAKGATRRATQHSYDYSAAIEWYTKQDFTVVEMRNGSFAPPKDFPVGVAAKGVPAIGVIFGDTYSTDFNFTCEGLGQLRGQPSWQVRFEQRLDRTPRIYQWTIAKHTYPAMLKGRAWISTGSFHILRLEIDLAKPIPDIRLDTHHMAIDYLPVRTSNGKQELWLPAMAEVHSLFGGRYVRERHDFSAFTLFSVEASSTEKNPTLESKP